MMRGNMDPMIRKIYFRGVDKGMKMKSHSYIKHFYHKAYLYIDISFSRPDFPEYELYGIGYRKGKWSLNG